MEELFLDFDQFKNCVICWEERQDSGANKQVVIQFTIDPLLPINKKEKVFKHQSELYSLSIFKNSHDPAGQTGEVTGILYKPIETKEPAAKFDYLTDLLEF